MGNSGKNKKRTKGAGSAKSKAAGFRGGGNQSFQLHHLGKYAEIGMSLSGEEDVNRLLEMIIHEAREITSADAGTLYMINEEGTHLGFVVLQNDTMNTRMGGASGVEIDLPPVPLSVEDGPNFANVSSYVAQTGEIVNIADVYESKDFDFTGPRKYDEATGYRSKSMLVIPMRNHENDIIGVVQLLNAQDEASGGQVVEFPDEHVALVASLASQAAAALTKTKLLQDLKDLFYAFIKSIANAIEEKSPYTGGHINRVVDLSMMMAEKINNMDEGPFADAHFSEDDLEELKLAAWLHDIGKIITPEYVVDKASKLETIFDRVHMVEARFDLIAKSLELDFVRQKMKLLEAGNPDHKKIQDLDEKMKQALAEFEEEKAFVLGCNSPGEFMSDERIERLKEIGAKTFEVGGEKITYLTENEIYNLSIRKGTLTFEERKIIENHATMTGKMLSELPFPKKLARVPEYAAGHHEKMDGTGYPLGLKGEELSLQARIMAVADIFEALTAKDRPYKKPMPLSQAIKILGFMKKDNHIDPDVHDLFLSSGMFEEYAKKELDSGQCDCVEVEPDLKKRSVFLAVGGAPDMEGLRDMFTGWGAELTEISDGADALEKLKEAFSSDAPYRIALLDEDLPSLDGLSVAKEMKAEEDPEYPMGSIILLRPEGASENPDLSAELGVAGCVSKPVDRADLKKIVFEIMKHPSFHAVRRPSDDRREAAPGEGEGQGRILLVDDSANTRMLVRYYLKNTPYQIDMAENGHVAVDRFMEQKYDVVIMGMHMPVMDGSSATKAIRDWEEENKVPQVPIIALTDHYIPNDGRNSILAGCSAHLAKPVDKAELLGLIKHFTGAETSEVREKKALEEENARLKKLVARQSREIDSLKKSRAKK